MIYLIVGHRGVGKTTWLKKIKTIFKSSGYYIDLDEQIEKHAQLSISQLILDSEKKFRKKEMSILKKILHQYQKTKKPIFISLGAGIIESIDKIQNIKTDKICIVHLMRETDSHGRIFLNRPRLNLAQTSYKEYLALYKKREPLYQKLRDESFVLPEWDFSFTLPEKLFFNRILTPKKYLSGETITLNKNTLPTNLSHWKNFIKKRILWGIRFFELRDDEWKKSHLRYATNKSSLNQLKFLLKIIPKKNQLLSFRKQTLEGFSKKDLPHAFWDWPLEKSLKKGFLLTDKDLTPSVLSVHKRIDKNISRIGKKLLSYQAKHYKLAIPIFNFKELMQGHLWFLADSKHRSFLPHSPTSNSKWRWYRQIFGSQMLLSFLKETNNGPTDQPFLHEALSAKCLPKTKKTFGAVLGEPIFHSASPGFYRKFFSKKKILFTKIPMNLKELTKKNLWILNDLGLIYGAVTSPLKKKMFKLCDQVSLGAQKSRAVNTIIFKQKKIWGYNTDEVGLKALLAQKMDGFVDKKSIGVWGGGGLKELLRKLLLKADFYSARTGKKRGKEIMRQKKGYDIVIWAVGRGRMKHCLFPPAVWKPKVVVDLNYTMDSPGKEYALKVGAQYISGKQMFRTQAKMQLTLFLKNLC